VGFEFLTVREAADLCRVHPATIRRWIDNGTLPAVHLGKGVRIRKRDLDALTDTEITRDLVTKAMNQTGLQQAMTELSARVQEHSAQCGRLEATIAELTKAAAL
jgi:excisionase family DNA binding protein